MKEPFVILPKKIFDYQLSPIPFKGYCYLRCCDNQKNVCYQSRLTISKACGTSGSSLGRAAKELENKGLVRVKHNFGDGRQGNTFYELLTLEAPETG